MTKQRPRLKSRSVKVMRGCEQLRSHKVYVSPKEGDYARAEALGVRVVLMLVETFGGLGPALVEELRKGAEWRANKLTASKYDETTWSAHIHMAFMIGGRSTRPRRRWPRRSVCLRSVACWWRPTHERRPTIVREFGVPPEPRSRKGGGRIWRGG